MINTIGGTKLYSTAQKQVQPFSKYNVAAIASSQNDSARFSGAKMDALKSIFRLYGDSIFKKIMYMPLSAIMIPFRTMLQSCKFFCVSLPKKILGLVIGKKA